MDKIKIHELAKKLKKSSKEIIDMASKLGIELKSHLSTIEGEDATKIEKEMKKAKKEKVEKKQEDKKQSNSTPVIIRREVIISDDELEKEAAKKAKKEEERKNVGFVERNKNKEYNIVYREKPTKPMTASELFGLASKPKKEEQKPEEIENKEIKEEIKEEPKEEAPKKEEIKKEKEEIENKEVKEETKREIKEVSKQSRVKNNQSMRSTT